VNVASAIERAGNVAHERRDASPVLRRTAELVAALVSRDLGVPVPRVRWLPGSSKDLGCVYPTRPTEIWVAVQASASLIEAVSHEVRHLWQIEGFDWTAQTTEEDLERDAWIYGKRIRAELTGGW
jgi:hypothetical protein